MNIEELEAKQRELANDIAALRSKIECEKKLRTKVRQPRQCYAVYNAEGELQPWSVRFSPQQAIRGFLRPKPGVKWIDFHNYGYSVDLCMVKPIYQLEEIEQ